MPSIIEERPALHDALDSLHKASSTPAKQRTVKVSGVIDVICRHAFDDGLDPDALRDVVQLVSVKTNLDQTSVTTLVKNLYPSRRVPVGVVVTVVGALGLGKGKPSPSTQDSLVKWLTTVHEIIEDPNVLSRLYGVLFGMLDMISIRTSLCHLLSLITRRIHVKPYRIQQILELSRGLGNEPALQGLLRIFKDYYPDIILGSASTNRKSFAPQPDAEWRTRISIIQDASTAADDTLSDRHNGFKVLRKGSQRSKMPAIPEVHTYHATEASVTLEGIDTADAFAEKLDRIEPPGQLISFLTDPLLQKYVELRPIPIISTRISLWLSTCLEDLYDSEALELGDPQYLKEVIDGLTQNAKYTKTLHPAALTFLKVYMPIWNGQENVDSILALLAHIPIDSFRGVYTTFFLPAEKVLAPKGSSGYQSLIEFYTSVLQQHLCVASSQAAQHGSSVHQVFHDMAAHVSTISTSLLLSLPSGSGHPLVSSVLSYYELLSASSNPHTVPIVLPPMHLIYLLAQDSSPSTLSRICGIIGSYKQAFDRHPKPVKDYYSTIVTDSLNWCLRDLYHLMWISRALLMADGKAMGLYCDPALRETLNEYLNSTNHDYAVSTAFGLSNSFCLASMSAAAWRTMEEREIKSGAYNTNKIRYHQGPVSKRSLDALRKKGGVSVDWDGSHGYKVFVLNWLTERGLGGIRELMFATVTELRGKALTRSSMILILSRVMIRTYAIDFRFCVIVMKFGTTLRKSVYQPWKDKYIDYDKLKKLLKDNEDDDTWTNDDEEAFVNELANVQLEKVHGFIQEMSQKLRDRTSACEKKLEPLAVGIQSDDNEDGKKDDKGEGLFAQAGDASKKPELSQEDKQKLLQDVLKELDIVTKETKELEGFSRLNFTAIIKATKKHDKIRGASYRLRPFIDARIARHPLHSEDASPLLYRLSALYSFVRQSLEGKAKDDLAFDEDTANTSSFHSHKFWVHMDNLFEVKTVILRRLPVLVYNPQSSKIAEGSQRDPTITSIYFDNPNFSLYTDKVNSKQDASSLRLRWFGQLSEKPEIMFEKKVIKEDNAAEEVRFPIKAKYVQPFLEDKYHMEKSIEKLEYRRNKDQNELDQFKKAVTDIQGFVKDQILQPVLRANYTRTAFQIPGEDNIRISLDTNLALIREDALDMDRPCRDPEDWHRRDIDSSNMEFPFRAIKKGELHKFPYAMLEIKVKKGIKKQEWIEDLMNSHLVKESPRFSKFVHGVAKLFEDNVNTFPFWLSEIDNDIRKEPEKAFDDEQERKRKAAEDDFVVGSLFGARASPSYRPSITSPAGTPAATLSVPKSASAAAHSQPVVGAPIVGSHLSYISQQQENTGRVAEEHDSSDDEGLSKGKKGGLAAMFPSFSTSKYARKQRNKIQLPPGIVDPGVWIKDQGIVRVEPKVWLANQRTYIKWQHVSVLLASLSLGLYNAAGENNDIARALAVVYTCVAAFTLVWGYGIYMYRNKLIRERSPKDFDAVLGPLVVCVGLAVALCLNFAFKYNVLAKEKHHHGSVNATIVDERMELRL
ncbi:VTC domain-containing protein [Phaeosphaeriaceae sp. PMI808]|nr:VTC domain-containing protein [Phaeosphaeriaceae sp. PMI808]